MNSKNGKSIIKFSPQFRQSAMDNLSLSEEGIRELELEVIKMQKELREGINH